mgnify:CR=1 FL=1
MRPSKSEIKYQLRRGFLSLHTHCKLILSMRNGKVQITKFVKWQKYKQFLDFSKSSSTTLSFSTNLYTAGAHASWFLYIKLVGLCLSVMQAEWYQDNRYCWAIQLARFKFSVGNWLEWLRLGFAYNCLEFCQPFSCLYQAMQTRKTFSIA